MCNLVDLVIHTFTFTIITWLYCTCLHDVKLTIYGKLFHMYYFNLHEDDFSELLFSSIKSQELSASILRLLHLLLENASQIHPVKKLIIITFSHRMHCDPPLSLSLYIYINKYLILSIRIGCYLKQHSLRSKNCTASRQLATSNPDETLPPSSTRTAVAGGVAILRKKKRVDLGSCNSGDVFAQAAWVWIETMSSQGFFSIFKTFNFQVFLHNYVICSHWFYQQQTSERWNLKWLLGHSMKPRVLWMQFSPVRPLFFGLSETAVDGVCGDWGRLGLKGAGMGGWVQQKWGLLTVWWCRPIDVLRFTMPKIHGVDDKHQSPKTQKDSDHLENNAQDSRWSSRVWFWVAFQWRLFKKDNLNIIISTYNWETYA